ncbi:hypothetical protein [Brevibacillus sp. FIR094]|uniref:hypothetical protein n=1 Tax=Brevibacillus sp. FIR094 TaxID=3134809 RepID=UPI003D1DDAD9
MMNTDDLPKPEHQGKLTFKFDDLFERRALPVSAIASLVAFSYASALAVYDSVMDLCERYENPDDETFERTVLVYSYSLTEEQVTPWNNRYMGIRELEELCEAGELYLKEHGYEI